MSNAIRYTPSGGSIRLTWRLSDDGALVGVQDTGIGVAPEHIPRLTERFYRVDKSRSRETGGTGLGLAIANAIVEGHGGEISVASEPGDTTFTVRIPVNPAAGE